MTVLDTVLWKSAAILAFYPIKQAKFDVALLEISKQKFNNNNDKE